MKFFGGWGVTFKVLASDSGRSEELRDRELERIGEWGGK
jgi:hypothetical protein